MLIRISGNSRRLINFKISKACFSSSSSKEGTIMSSIFEITNRINRKEPTAETTLKPDIQKPKTQKPFIVPSYFKTEDITTKALLLIKYLHWLYDRNKELNSKCSFDNTNILTNSDTFRKKSLTKYLRWMYDGIPSDYFKNSSSVMGKLHSENSYYQNFSAGFNEITTATKNCLIIEGKNGIPIAKVHTPLGSLTVVGENRAPLYLDENGTYVDSDFLLSHELFEHIECVKIHPAIIKGKCIEGPFWLVKSIHGIPVEHPDVKLIPSEWKDEPVDEPNDEKNDDMKKRYFEQLCGFFKFANKNWYSTQQSKLLLEWIKNGYISDTDGISRILVNKEYDFRVNYSDGYNYYKAKLFVKISPDLQNYVSNKSFESRILSLIYLAKMNDNTFPATKSYKP
jgi:hypothetical protein